MEMIGRNDGEKFYNDCEMDKQSWKWGEKKGGWEFSLESAKPLAKRVEEVEVDRDCAYIGFRWPGCERVSFGSTFFFFSPLCIFSPIFLPPPFLSVLLFTVATTADICVAVIEQHCFGKNLFHGIVRPRCNCTVLMSEEDVRWYRNVDFRMIDDAEM